MSLNILREGACVSSTPDNGQDIDFTCVQMCRINMRIYGLGAMVAVGDTLREPVGTMQEGNGRQADEVGQMSLFG